MVTIQARKRTPLHKSRINLPNQRNVRGNTQNTMKKRQKGLVKSPIPAREKRTKRQRHQGKDGPQAIYTGKDAVTSENKSEKRGRSTVELRIWRRR